ncbi:oxidoreductase [Myxococcus sp. CA051A]|uniref:WD40/YVTN/BNR-like repeat-containing protein n=1 Tax=Myxococcus sp. CA051A TaxID=2741739 RepID=UPI00157A9783|nr:oxidoreductase [Myxococcus sp. CA051A]NTX61062.1 oxidoreductase [Myxococcus sp. CA051A]
MMTGAIWLTALLSLGSAEMKWVTQDSHTTVRLRGVSAVDGRVAWASGDKGTFVRTTDGGQTWKAGTVPGAEALDFRDVDAFSDTTAYLLSIGEGDKSRIYKTVDGGEHWTLQFTNPTPGAFFDGMAFWDEKHGLAFSDPVEGHFLVVATSDGGATWTPLPAQAFPPALPGEAGFAASGTSIAVRAPKQAWFGLGGAAARVLRTSDGGKSWSVATTPLATGEGGGVFSLVFWSERDGIAVGGNHKLPMDAKGNLALTRDGGKTWSVPGGARPAGYRSCVAQVHGAPGPTLVTVGPSGSEMSADGARSWQSLGSTGFHAVSASLTGKRVWAVGDAGIIAMLQRVRAPLPTPSAPSPSRPRR